jgi:hypothetical protein
MPSYKGYKIDKQVPFSIFDNKVQDPSQQTSKQSNKPPTKQKIPDRILAP